MKIKKSPFGKGENSIATGGNLNPSAPINTA